MRYLLLLPCVVAPTTPLDNTIEPELLGFASGEQILRDFDRLERWFASRLFRRLPFVDAIAELKEPKHAANKIASGMQGAAAGSGFEISCNSSAPQTRMRSRCRSCCLSTRHYCRWFKVIQR